MSVAQNLTLIDAINSNVAKQRRIGVGDRVAADAVWDAQALQPKHWSERACGAGRWQCLLVSGIQQQERRSDDEDAWLRRGGSCGLPSRLAAEILRSLRR